MLQIVIPETEMWDEYKQEFVTAKAYTLQLEHSLVSLSKWESKWCKPFISKDGLTVEETVDYIRCMTITQNVPAEAYMRITDDHIAMVNDYINAPMTATWFSENNKKANKKSGEQITSELIYYWMIALNVPMKCEKWHLNRLLTLIRVCEAKSDPDKNKKSKKNIMSEYTALNRANRQKFNSRG